MDNQLLKIDMKKHSRWNRESLSNKFQ